MVTLSVLVSNLDAELVHQGYKNSTMLWYRGCWRRLERFSPPAAWQSSPGTWRWRGSTKPAASSTRSRPARSRRLMFTCSGSRRCWTITRPTAVLRRYSGLGVEAAGVVVHPRPDERREVESRVAVQHGLVVHDLVGRLGSVSPWRSRDFGRSVASPGRAKRGLRDTSSLKPTARPLKSCGSVLSVWFSSTRGVHLVCRSSQMFSVTRVHRHRQ